MGEILSIIKLKDKVTITVLMSILALIVTGGVGAATYATRHQHNYEYHLERGEDGEFDLVGYCDSEDCDMPVYPRDIEPGQVYSISSEGKAPTCYKPGTTVYGFTFGGVTYRLEEDIPVVDHKYKLEGGINASTIKGVCVNEGCTESAIEIKQSEIEDLKLESVLKEATCKDSRVETKYSYTLNGEKKTLISVTEKKIAHTVGGVPVTDHIIGIPFINTEFYKYGAPGIIAIPVEGASICYNIELPGYYVCEACGTVEKIFVYKDSHTYALKADETNDPTLDSEGLAHIKCTEKYCDGHVPVILPAITVGENAEVIKQNNDTETQIVKYTYNVEEYGIVIEREIEIPWEYHEFVIIDEETVNPTFDSDGKMVFRCNHSVCDEERIVVLPKLETGVNTVITEDHINEKKIITYTYDIDEFNETYTFSYDVEWIDHTYGYVDADTVRPTVDSDGKAYVRCTYEGCDKFHEISIPKINIGKNTKLVSKATELSPRIDLYTYTNTKYNFTVSFEVEVGERLSHNYKYHLDIMGLGVVELVGVCRQPGCQEPETREIVQAVMSEIAPDCTNMGYLIFTYERDGEVYEESMPYPALGHSYEVDYSTVVNPTEKEQGSVVIRCTRKDCGETKEIILPKIDISEGGNAEEIAFDQDTERRTVKYVYVDGTYRVEVNLEIALSWASHKYAIITNKTVNPTLDSNGKVTIACQNTVCTENHKEYVVDLPKLVIGADGNGVETDFNQDKETKTVLYIHEIPDFGVMATLELTLTWPEHKYSIITDKTVNPTLDSNGKVTVACQNTVCTENHKEYVVDLPKLVIGAGGNGVETDFNQDKETKTVRYTYVIRDHGVTVTLDLTLPWREHKYAIDTDKTVNPTLDSKGQVTLVCQNSACSENPTIVTVDIPELVIGEGGNTEEIAFNQDKETKTVRYTYVIGDYGVTVTLDLTLPWPEHRYQLKSEENEYPTFDTEGKVYLYCQNTECSNRKIEVVLPKIEIDVNTQVVQDHIAEIETLIYVYDNEEYDFTVTFSFDREWINHTYVYSPDETVYPTLDSDGIAYVRCNYEGCEKYHEITIPKIVESDHKVEEATEQHARIIRYKYECKEYSFTVEFDYYVGSPLSHNPVYELVYNEETNTFDLVGRCNQPGCQNPEEIETNVDAIHFEIEATCTTPKKIIASYEKNGVTVNFEEEVGEPLGHEYHDYLTGIGIYECIDPTYDTEGYINVFCTRDNCDYTAHVILPKIEMGVTAFEIIAGDGLHYLYKDDESGYEHFFFI